MDVMSNRAYRSAVQPHHKTPPPAMLVGERKSAPRADIIKDTIQAAPPYRLCSARRGLMLVNENDIYMGRAFLKYGECCEAELGILLQLIKLPGLVIEAGANMGIHTIPLAAQLAQEGREMLVFEPQPVIFQQLCANLALNGLLNVTALPYACGVTAGMVSFEVPDYRNTNNSGGLSMSPNEGSSGREGSAARTETVPCVRLDDLVPVAQVGFLKVDVEGEELAVLQGATRILRRSQSILYVENDRVENSPALIEWLWAQGYDLYWHRTPLFNANNYNGVAENIHGTICSFNMLCLPQGHSHAVEGVMRITSARAHPLQPSS